MMAHPDIRRSRMWMRRRQAGVRLPGYAGRGAGWRVLALTAWMIGLCDGAAAQRTEPVTESIGLFKNGLAVVTRRFAFPGDEAYVLDGISDAVHGTLWVESTRPIRIRAARAVPVPSAAGPTRVTVTFSDAAVAPLTGEVLSEESSVDWGRDYATLGGPRPQHWMYSSVFPRAAVDDNGRRDDAWLRVRGENGIITSVDPRLVAHAEFRRGDRVWISGADRLKVRPEPALPDARPVLRITSEDGAPGSVEVVLRYVARGASWAPSYVVSLSEADRTLRLRQRAVIRNELMPLRSADISLISGFPSIECAQIPSLLGGEQSLQSFFSALSRSAGPPAAGMHSQMLLTSNAVIPGRGTWNSEGVVLPGADADNLELHWQSVGALAMLPGETLGLQVAQSSCDYERIVSWDLASRRQWNGRPADTDVEEPWDCIRFDNPLPFPMTSAPVAVYRGSRFLAQSRTGWVSRSESCQVRLTKALNVRAHDEEIEEARERREVHVAGRTYWECQVKGTLTVTNYRPQTVSVDIRRRFYGDLMNAEGSPQHVHPKEGVHSVNRLNELRWDIKLESGQTRTLTYRYTILAS